MNLANGKPIGPVYRFSTSFPHRNDVAWYVRPTVQRLYILTRTVDILVIGGIMVPVGSSDGIRRYRCADGSLFPSGLPDRKEEKKRPPPPPQSAMDVICLIQ